MMTSQSITHTHTSFKASNESRGHGEGGPATKLVIVGYGFWIFLLSDIVMFSAFFAAHAVLQTATDGGPKGSDLLSLRNVGIETACLLLSSFTCGLIAISVEARRMIWAQAALLSTGLLGFTFIFLEVREFSEMISTGAGPERSAFLSSFFALVGCHGLHVSVGLLWLGTMMAQLYVKGFRDDIQRRLLCFNLFWHMLDIVWIAVFTLVYLVGGAR
ncbi:MAG: cytochrome o ubiquinol oxidase subunit III [Methylocystaceae bacterium]|jgi:cytochrome o ubiquinol oxidase subunit 3|nr:cytochrome o ubiquinol oxidase subunit III [Methylocystaceae bacterium]